jgi:diaminopimelate decarboxylase
MAVEAACPIAVDNSDELDALESLLSTSGQTAQILVRFRGMPLSGLTAADQTTAADWTKFGFHIDEAPALWDRLASSERVVFRGISAHIGTQIADPRGFERLLGHLLDLAERAQARGLDVELIDIGGGFPVSFLSEEEWGMFQQRLLQRMRGEVDVSGAVTWNDIPMGYARTARDQSPDWIGKSYWSRVPISRMLAHLLGTTMSDGRSVIERLTDLGNPTLMIEPGRSLMASAGITLTEVIGVKDVLGHPVVSLDMGINNHGTNLISPDIFPAVVLPRRTSDRATEAFLAGRLCFSGDMISKAKVTLNRLPERGESFVLYHTGAYSADHFASNSCGFPRPAKVAIRSDGTAELWRAPETFASLHGAADYDLTIRGV